MSDIETWIKHLLTPYQHDRSRRTHTAEDLDCDCPERHQWVCLLKLIPHYFTKSTRQNYNENLYCLVLWIALKFDECNKLNKPFRSNVKVTDPSPVSNINYDSMNFNLHFIHRLFEDLKDNIKCICTVKQNNILFTILITIFRLLYHHQTIHKYI
jgi:hypothetical protein